MQCFQTRFWVIVLIGLALVAVPALATPPRGLAPTATRSGGVHLAAPRTLGNAADSSLTCFEGPLSLVLNPGCFSPPGAGDCVAHSNQLFVQYIYPNFSVPQRVRGFGFISNDGATVFPAAGVVLIPDSQIRFPRRGELDSLQVHNVPTPHDTAIVVVDLRPYNLVVQPGMDVVVCLRFPEGGSLVGVGNGPGILVDEVVPDQTCDYFTVDNGASYYSNAEGDPLDWGFEVIFEPAGSAIEATSWSDLKKIYGGERLFPYRNP